MSWDLDCMSVLPDEIQNEVADNFSPQFLAEKLSDYIVVLEKRINDLSAEIDKLKAKND